MNKQRFIGVKLLFFLVCINGTITTLAQKEDVSYYINVNESNPSKVHEVYKRKLALQYQDNFGVWPTMNAVIYDWKMSKITEVRLTKERGLNHFVLTLDELGSDWNYKQIYRVILATEDNRKREIVFKLVEPVKSKFAINILTNPIQFNCESNTQKLVEFYGVIEGGTAPYTAQWFVVNEAKNDLLYQPMEIVVSKAGNTSVVQVDKNPEYYVMLYVTDQCGTIEKKMLRVACETGDKKIHSVFVEPLNKELLNKTNAIKN